MKIVWVLMMALGLASARAQAAELTVSAAVSLKAALEEIAARFEKTHAGTKVTFNFGASGALQQQIENGAPVDVFVSAASKQVDELEKKGLTLDGTRIDVVGNTLVLVVPKAGKTTVTKIEDLKSETVKKIAIGEPKAVPAGTYAMEVLTAMKLADAVEKRLVFGMNVQQVLTFVESGNADAGFVYGSDARGSKNVTVVATADAKLHKPITYPAVVLKKSKNPATARQLLDVLGEDESRKVFEKHGFTPVPAKAS